MNPKPITRNQQSLIGLAISLFAFIMYFITANRTVSFIDAGELATVVTTLGIAHPTGYPLFTLLYHFVSKLPLGIPIIFQLNLFAAFLCSVGVYFFFQFLVFFTTQFTANDSKTGGIYLHYAPAICGTLLLALSETYWSQAVAIEVYSLHTIFLSSLLLLFTKAIYLSHKQIPLTPLSRGSNPKNVEEGEASSTVLGMTGKHYFLVFAFVLGLSFSNHLTTILLAPALLYVFFHTFGFKQDAWKRILSMALPFLAGLSVYCYLPIRSSQNPMFDWGHPATLEKFFWHVRGKQFSVWIFSSAEVAKRQFNYFVTHLPSEFAYIGLLLAVIGFFLLVKDKRALWFTALLFAGCILYSINYDIHDIDSYFLLAYYTVAIWSAFGVRWVLNRFTAAKKPAKQQQQPTTTQTPAIISFSLAAVIVCLSIAVNYNNVDESSNHLVEDYTKNILNSVEQNAIVISFEWDYFVSASYYFQNVEHIRPDVTVIDKELLRRSWYFGQLERHYPWLTDSSRKEIDNFGTELDKFEHNVPYDNLAIESRYRDLIISFIAKNIAQRPIYVTQEIEAEYTQGFARVPEGLLFRLVKAGEPMPQPQPKLFPFRNWEKEETMVNTLKDLYARGYINQAMYLARSGRKQEALPLLDEALKIVPGKREALQLKRQLGAK